MSLNKYEAQEIAVLGEIKFSVVYDKQLSTLKLLVIKAEQLAKDVKERHHLNIFLKVCLLPDKSRKQRSLVVKGTHHPLYNHEFTFTNLTVPDLEENVLRLRACNRLSGRKYTTLGEVVLPLQDLGLQHGEEVRMWRDLEAKHNDQVRFN